MKWQFCISSEVKSGKILMQKYVWSFRTLACSVLLPPWHDEYWSTHSWFACHEMVPATALSGSGGNTGSIVSRLPTKKATTIKERIAPLIFVWEHSIVCAYLCVRTRECMCSGVFQRTVMFSAYLCVRAYSCNSLK